MSVRVGINGFGRIGRAVYRLLSDREDLEVVAINDLYDNEQLAYLLRFDTVQGRFDKDVVVLEDELIVDGEHVAMTEERDPKQIPWGTSGSTWWSSRRVCSGTARRSPGISTAVRRRSC